MFVTFLVCVCQFPIWCLMLSVVHNCIDSGSLPLLLFIYRAAYVRSKNVSRCKWYNKGIICASKIMFKLFLISVVNKTAT